MCLQLNGSGSLTGSITCPNLRPPPLPLHIPTQGPGSPEPQHTSLGHKQTSSAVRAQALAGSSLGLADRGV